MDYEVVFSLANLLALVSWGFLFIFPFRPFTNKVVIGVSVFLLAMVYSYLLFNALQPIDLAKFKTLPGVMGLFSDKGTVLTGWVHYLAFDLMVGLFIAHNAAQHGITYLLVFPCLLFTLFLGPFGLLLYLIIRWSLTKQWFTENF